MKDIVIINSIEAYAKNDDRIIEIRKDNDEFLYNKIVEAVSDNTDTSDIFAMIANIVDEQNMIYDIEKIELPQGFKFKDNKLVYTNIELAGNIVKRFEMSNEVNRNRMVKFINKLAEVDSRLVFDMICGFLEANPDIMFDDDGDLLMWKAIDDDYCAHHSNPDGTRNFHKIGIPIEMKRDEVERNKEVTCSSGLHVCSKSYLPYYAGGSDILVECKVDVRDIVSIPSDYNNAKIRCCKYVPIAFFDKCGEEVNEKCKKIEETHNDDVVQEDFSNIADENAYISMNRYIESIRKYLKTIGNTKTIRQIQQGCRTFRRIGVKGICDILVKIEKAGYISLDMYAKTYSNIKVTLVK